jgi:hypothetical protein
VLLTESSQHNGLKDPIPFPQKLVSLTQLNNDGLLANHIAKAEKNILRIYRKRHQ